MYICIKPNPYTRQDHETTARSSANSPTLHTEIKF